MKKYYFALRLLSCVAGLMMFSAAYSATTLQHGESMQTVKRKFEVTMQPQKDGDFNAGRMTLDKSYEGALNAVGKGQMLSHVTDVKGSAGYVAIEHVTGTLEGNSGTFVLQHSGMMSAGDQALDIKIIPDSATGELTGLKGSMHIDIVDGEHFYILTYSLE